MYILYNHKKILKNRNFFNFVLDDFILILYIEFMKNNIKNFKINNIKMFFEKINNEIIIESEKTKNIIIEYNKIMYFKIKNTEYTK